jgi:1-deoxyxylulose-5-phosphate synthase
LRGRAGIAGQPPTGSRPDQLQASLDAADLVLDGDLKRQLDELTHEYRMGDDPR